MLAYEFLTERELKIDFLPVWRRAEDAHLLSLNLSFLYQPVSDKQSNQN